MSRTQTARRRPRLCRLRRLALRAGVAAGLAAALAGCISFGPKTPDELVSLTPQRSPEPGAMGAGKLSDAILVADPDTDRSLDVLRVPVRIGPSTVAYLKDASWVEKPSRQFRGLLAETLRAKTGRLVVEGGDYEITGRQQLIGRLLDMGYDAPTGSVVVRYDAMLREGETIRASRRFEATVPGVEAKAAAVTPALNQAANDVAQQVADWVAGQS